VKKIKTHTFRIRKRNGQIVRRRYEIIYGPVDGMCDTITAERKPLLINRTDMATCGYLETVIHESIHAVRPYISEACVTHMGEELARFLWRMGYRIKEKDG
jgi:hypothetical protein